MTDLSDIVTSAFWRVNPPAADPLETREWLEAFDALVATEGRERATYLLLKLLEHARARRVPLPPVLNTPYKNSIALADQAQFPGNLELESRLSSIVRWNALAMVVRANKAYGELGGHISSYASAADLFEVGFNHFFRGHEAPGTPQRAGRGVTGDSGLRGGSRPGLARKIHGLQLGGTAGSGSGAGSLGVELAAPGGAAGAGCASG